MNPSLQSLCRLCFTDCRPLAVLHPRSTHAPRGGCPYSWKRLEWRVLLQSGCSQASHRLCISWQTCPVPAVLEQSPGQGPTDTWPCQSPENKAGKPPCLSPPWAATCPASDAGPGRACGLQVQGSQSQGFQVTLAHHFASRCHGSLPRLGSTQGQRQQI